MPDFRFLHAADLHLDSPFAGLEGLPAAVRKEVRESTFQAMKKLVQAAMEQEVDFVVVSGDIYDAADRSLKARIAFQQAAEQLAEQGISIYAVHGNHDPLNSAKAGLAWPESVHVFGADEVSHRDVQLPGKGAVARIHGISYAYSAVRDNLSLKFPEADPGIFHIGLLHANVDGHAAHDNYAPCSIADLMTRGMDYWALGHVHQRRVLNEQPWIVYPGNIQGRHIRETGEKGCMLVQISEGGAASLEFIPTDVLRWHHRELSISDLAQEQELIDAIRSEMDEIRNESNGRSGMLRLTLTGRGPLHAFLNDAGQHRDLIGSFQEEEAAYAEAGEPFLWLESLRDETGSAVNRQALLEDDGFLGDLLRMSEELMGDAEQLQEVCLSALKPLPAKGEISRLLRGQTAEQQRDWLQRAQELAIDLLADGRTD